MPEILQMSSQNPINPMTFFTAGPNCLKDTLLANDSKCRQAGLKKGVSVLQKQLKMLAYEVC